MIDNSMMAKERYFVVITPGEVYIALGGQELYDILHNRICPVCEVYGLNTLEEAHVLAKQRWPYRFYTNPAFGGRTPMPLPATGTFQLKDSSLLEQPALQTKGALCDYPAFGIIKGEATSVQTTDQPAAEKAADVNVGITWGIDAINGYGTAPNLDCLIYYLVDPRWGYPHALTWWDASLAIAKAYEAYLGRFFRRYDSAMESAPVHNPSDMGAGDCFEDGYYADREKSRVEDAVFTRLVSYGLF